MPQLIELETKAEMLKQLSIIQQLYPDYTLEIYGNLLDKMIPHNYKQIVVVESNITMGLGLYRDWETDRKSTRLNSSHLKLSRMPSSA